jgi:hypothetical protein
MVHGGGELIDLELAEGVGDLIDAGEVAGPADLDLSPDPRVVGMIGERLVVDPQEGPGLGSGPAGTDPDRVDIAVGADEDLGVLVVAGPLGGEVTAADPSGSRTGGRSNSGM